MLLLKVNALRLPKRYVSNYCNIPSSRRNISHSVGFPPTSYGTFTTGIQLPKVAPSCLCCYSNKHYYSTAASKGEGKVVESEVLEKPSPAADPASAPAPEPVVIEVGDSVYAIWGDDGLYYVGTVQEVRAESQEYVIEFDNVPEGEKVIKVVPAKNIFKESEDSVTSFVVNNFIISDKETASIPPENWDHASQMAWKALAKATVAVFVVFAGLLVTLYLTEIRPDPQHWHANLGKWVRTTFGIPERNANKITIPISWTELMIMLRDGQPPERVREEMERLAKDSEKEKAVAHHTSKK